MLTDHQIQMFIARAREAEDAVAIVTAKLALQGDRDALAEVERLIDEGQG